MDTHWLGSACYRSLAFLKVASDIHRVLRASKQGPHHKSRRCLGPKPCLGASFRRGPPHPPKKTPINWLRMSCWFRVFMALLAPTAILRRPNLRLRRLARKPSDALQMAKRRGASEARMNVGLPFVQGTSFFECLKEKPPMVVGFQWENTICVVHCFGKGGWVVK